MMLSDDDALVYSALEHFQEAATATMQSFCSAG